MLYGDISFYSFDIGKGEGTINLKALKTISTSFDQNTAECYDNTFF